MPVAAVISEGSPFYRENAPVRAPEPEMTPPLEQRSFGEVGGGGVVAKERSEAWREGGLGGKRHVLLETSPL